MSTDRDMSWLSEFTITPHITHAVNVLRAAIPHRADIHEGGEGLTVIRKEDGTLEAESSRVVDDFHGTQEFEDFTLTEELETAAVFLLNTIAYYDQLIDQCYEEPSDEDIWVYAHAAVQPGVETPEGRLSAQNRLREDVTRKLNLGFELYTSEGSSWLSVYS